MGKKSLLSKKDIQVVRFMIQGLNTRDIGYEMNLSFRTIENKKNIMYKKLGVDSAIIFIRKIVRLNIDGIGNEFLHGTFKDVKPKRPTTKKALMEILNNIP